jgi:large subunit ribosomal protein L30e
MDLQKAIRIAVETGKTKMGSKQGKVAALKGAAKLLLISNNCQKNVKEEIVHCADKSKLPYCIVELSSMEIGSVCGKPFPVSVLSIIDPGNSEIMKVIETGVTIETEEKETRAAVNKREKARKKAERKESKETEESEESKESEIDSDEGKSGETE